MSDYELKTSVQGPKGIAEVATRATLKGSASFRVYHVASGKYAFYADYEEAMRCARELVGRDLAEYEVDQSPTSDS